MTSSVAPDYSPARTLLHAGLQHPSRTSLVWGFEGEKWTVSRSVQAVRRLAGMLADMTAPGDRVAVIGPNSPWHFVVHVAGAWAGTVTVPLSPRLPVAQLVDLLQDCSPRLVVTTDELAQLLRSTLGELELRQVVPGHEYSGEAELGEANPVTFHPQIWTFAELAAREASAAELPGLPPTRGEELAAIVYTSGSSGKPRGVELTHAQLWWGSMSFRDGFEYNPGVDVVGVCAPLSHIGGFNGTTLDAFAHGGTVVVLGAFEPVSVLQAIEKYRISQMFLVPVMCHLLADAQRNVQADVSSYRNPLIGGDAMGSDLEQRLRGMGLAPIHVWGMTETAGAGAMLSADVYAQHAGAIGLPFPYVDMRLLDADGRVLNPSDDAGVLGEIQVRGPGVSLAYYRRAEDTRRSRVDGWLKTGDLGSYDAQGFVHMVGRASRMIHTAGEMVAPTVVEQALRRVPGIADALVVGVPDKRWGQIVGALLVPAALETNVTSLEGSTLLNTQELQDLRRECEHFLAPWEFVRQAMWVDSLPLTSTGKPNPIVAQKVLSS